MTLSIRRLIAITTLVLGATAALLPTAQAASTDQYLVFNTVALHFKNADERNGFTPGIGWEYSPSGKVGFHVGTVKDSFGYQARYAGLNYATRPIAALDSRVRFILGATILHKQYHLDSDPETKIVPLPAVEFAMSDRAVLNVSGSPEIDFADHHNNAVLFFQFKLNM